MEEGNKERGDELALVLAFKMSKEEGSQKLKLTINSLENSSQRYLWSAVC